MDILKKIGTSIKEEFLSKLILVTLFTLPMDIIFAMRRADDDKDGIVTNICKQNNSGIWIQLHQWFMGHGIASGIFFGIALITILLNKCCLDKLKDSPKCQKVVKHLPIVWIGIFLGFKFIWFVLGMVKLAQVWDNCSWAVLLTAGAYLSQIPGLLLLGLIYLSLKCVCKDDESDEEDNKSLLQSIRRMLVGLYILQAKNKRNQQRESLLQQQNEDKGQWSRQEKKLLKYESQSSQETNHYHSVDNKRKQEENIANKFNELKKKVNYLENYVLKKEEQGERNYQNIKRLYQNAIKYIAQLQRKLKQQKKKNSEGTQLLQDFANQLKQKQKEIDRLIKLLKDHSIDEKEKEKVENNTTGVIPFDDVESEPAKTQLVRIKTLQLTGRKRQQNKKQQFEVEMQQIKTRNIPPP